MANQAKATVRQDALTVRLYRRGAGGEKVGGGRPLLERSSHGGFVDRIMSHMQESSK